MKHATRNARPPRRPAPAPEVSQLRLAAWQRLMFTAITRPLAEGDRIDRQWEGGRPAAKILAGLVKSGRGMQPIERVEIYNRMYWFRLLDSMAEDCPGLRALLGDRRFWKLIPVYLTKYPSRSFTLRDLPGKLARFIAEEPQLSGPHQAAARDMARFEWAQVLAFDGEARKPISTRALRLADPSELRVSLQPYLSLLSLEHAVDEYVIAIKKRDVALRASASQAVSERKELSSAPRRLRLRRERVFLAVHRVDNQIYYKRLDEPAYRILRALAGGRTLAEACAAGFRSAASAQGLPADQVKAWFTLWRRLGWICPR